MLSFLSTCSEKKAEKLLMKSGFQILGKNQKESIIIQVDGKDHLGVLEADYIVTRENKKYVAIVKSGEGVFDPTEPTLRRKLIEYYRVFSPSGILLVDINSDEIQMIKFRFPRERGVDFYFQFVTALFIVFLVIGIIWLMIQIKLF